MLRFLIFVLLAALGCEAFRTQSTSAKGRLMCGDKPAVGVQVQLFDQDDGPDPDDFLDQTLTKADGTFVVAGSSMELTNIDPEVRIFHDCNDHGKPCQREWVIQIPNKYITSGARPAKVFDLGEMNLEIELENESRSCVH